MSKDLNLDGGLPHSQNTHSTPTFSAIQPAAKTNTLSQRVNTLKGNSLNSPTEAEKKSPHLTALEKNSDSGSSSSKEKKVLVTLQENKPKKLSFTSALFNFQQRIKNFPNSLGLWEEEQKLSHFSQHRNIELESQEKESESNQFHPLDMLESIHKELKFLFSNQLTHLKQLCELKAENQDEIIFVINFCNKVIANDQGDIDLNRFLGQVIFLADKKFKKLISIVSQNDWKQAYKELKSRFQIEFEEIFQRVSAFEEQHEKCGIQDGRQARSTYLPVELSKALISDIGFINRGLIPYFKDKFVHVHRLPLPYEEDIIHMLNEFDSSKELSKTLELITKPKSTLAPANQLIRTIFSFPPGHVVTDLDAKRAALTGLLSHLRQGKVGSCFSTFLTISQLSNNPLQALLDFKSLLENSYLERTVDGKVVEFPFLLHLSKQSVEKKLTLNSQGYIVQSDGIKNFLWESPAFISACLQIGVDPHESCKKAISELFTTPSPLIKVSIKKILKIIVAHQKNPHRLALENAILAYESQLHNPLQRIWENSLAGMAETQRNGFLKANIIDTVLAILNNKLGELSIVNNSEWKRFLQIFDNILIYRMQLQYDPYLEKIEFRESAIGGGFVLYDRNHYALSTDWKRIDQGGLFQDFIKSIIEESTLESKKSMNLHQIQQFEKECEKLKSYISTSDFLIDILNKYQHNLRSKHNIYDVTIPLDHTPWIERSGNNPIEVLDTYYEKKGGKGERTLIFASDAFQLLKELIDMGKKQREAQQQIANKQPVYVVGNHAFNILTNGKLTDAYSSKNTNQWIQENLLQPGKKIAHSTITNECRDKIIKFVLKYIPNQLQKFFYSNLLLKPSVSSLKDFRKDIVDVIIETFPAYQNRKNELEMEIDTYLCQEGLTPNEREQIRDSAVHIADSNWGDSVHDWHFCLLVNPGSGKLEIWKAYDNGTHLLPLDQDKWIINQTWQFL